MELYLTNVEKPLRETIGFKALSPENAVKAIAEVKDLKTAVENLRKTRVILLLCVVILACAAAASLYFYRKAEKEKAIIAQTAEKTKQELKEDEKMEQELEQPELENKPVKKIQSLQDLPGVGPASGFAERILFDQ